MTTVGEHTYMGCGTEFREFEGTITIGDYCSLADSVLIIAGGEHRMDRVSTYPFDVKLGVGTLTSFSRGNVVIGSDVWIGTRAIILPGVTIGHGAIIGAGAVVTRDVPPYARAFGVPAKVKSYRFDDYTIDRLIKSAWWDWPEEKVIAMVPLMVDIPAFLKAAEV
jgi:acetyltransferase-like isoleucine patch superfamily enzyme